MSYTHDKGRDCARTEEVLEAYRRRAWAAEARVDLAGERIRQLEAQLAPEPRPGPTAARQVARFLDLRAGSTNLDPVEITSFNGEKLTATDLRTLVAAVLARPRADMNASSQVDPVYVYFTNERNGKVHLVPETGTLAERSLCGRSMAKCTSGDETISGIAATCHQCKRIMEFHR
jgi:hypothetical protein